MGREPRLPLAAGLVEGAVRQPDQQPAQKKAIKEILPFSDMVAVTAFCQQS